MSITTTQPLLSPSELSRVERLRLAPRRKFAGRMRGERISRQKGISVEFADFRDYTAGDDLRHLDWSILARLDRPTIRTYQDEDDLAVYVLVDTSASMDFGEPTKFSAAQKLTAAIGFAGLSGQDAVYPIALGVTARGRVRALRGRGSYGALSRWAAELDATGTKGIAPSLSQFANSGGYRPGMAVILTDALDPRAPDSIRACGARGHEVVVIQILSETELNPDLEGDLRLLDSESGEVVEITAHAEALREYRRNLDTHCEAVKEATLRAGGRYARFVTTDDAVDFVSGELRRIGVVE